MVSERARPVPLRDRVAAGVRRTPGRLAAAMAGLVVLGLAAGLAGVVGVRDRAGLVEGVAARSGPLAVAAQDLYRALSDADATAANAFLTGGIEPAAMRARYETSIAQAAAALATAAAGVGDGPAAAAIAEVSAGLPVYTGLIETARAHNRQGLPLGAAYLREASGLMRLRLLPAAQELYRAVSARLDAARGAAAAFPWLAVLLGGLTIAALVAIQVWLTRRTNRVFNVGLLLATAAGLAATLWLGFSAAAAAGHLDASRREGSAQIDVLAEARITALTARADEALTLVARGTGAKSEQNYTNELARLVGADGGGGLLAEAGNRATDDAARSAARSAREAALEWQTVHKRLRDLDNGGQYTEAVALATGAEPTSANGVFGRLDTELGNGIAHASQRFDAEARQAAGALSGVEVGVGLLTALLLAAGVVGLQQRLAEYR